MEEDIDIEEHNLLDNPVIRDMFPDIDDLKREIDDDDGKEKKLVSRTGSQDPTVDSTTTLVTTVKVESCDLVEDGIDSTEMKTDKNTIDLTDESVETEEIYCNKIILGTKPRKCLDYEEFFLEKSITQDVKVVIDDLHSYLMSSERYCEKCLTLFPDKPELNQHNKLFHSTCEEIDNDCSDSLLMIDPLRYSRLPNANKCRNKKKNVHHTKYYNRVPVNAENDKEQQPNHTATMPEFKEIKINTQQNRERKYYRCYVCLIYFNCTKRCSQHLLKRHGIIKKEFNKEAFNPNCELCPVKKPTAEELNIHIKKCHRTQPKKADEESEKGKRTSAKEKKQLILKSILFKCSKCDIHFLTTQDTMNHTGHMELLINWKCSICNRIFKKKDQTLHEMQHMFSNNITVYDLSSSELSRVLYKCTKCKIHFTEGTFFSHYPSCGINKNKSNRCRICDIVIDEGAISSHAIAHILEGSTFTVINSDVVSHIDGENHTSPVCKRGNAKIQRPNSLKRTIDSEYETQRPHVLKRKKGCGGKSKLPCEKNKRDSEREKEKVKDKDNPYKVYYCTTCRSYLDKNDYGIHRSGYCSKFGKCVCLYCGLTLTNKSFSRHLKLHSDKQSLKLRDFTFYDLGCRRPLRSPPLPEYPKCLKCKVTFISKFAVCRHNCSDQEYLICNICKDKISEAAFVLHMAFHDYSSQPETVKQKNERYSSNKKKTSAVLQTHRTGYSSVATNSNMKKKMCKINVSDHSKEVLPAKKYSNQDQSKTLNAGLNTEKELNKTTHESDNNVESPISPKHYLKQYLPDTDQYPILIYSCKNCGTTFDTYDKVIEHCQKHYENDEETETSLCELCDLKFEKNCYETHEKQHGEKTFFKLLFFDILFFTAERDVWIKHIFGSLPQRYVDEILNKSIYKYECRVKLEIVQEGAPHFTVYECDKCQCFIDGSILYNHAENSCFKLRKHPCSVCGLPFMSSSTRIEHEKIHETANVRMESYRIVIFNQEKDRKFNLSLRKRKFFPLYQCRNCYGTEDKSQIKNHHCNNSNLRKCLQCGLLFSFNEFETHSLRHKKLAGFTQNNMKVLLFSSKNDSASITKTIIPSYVGIAYDHTYYTCSKCSVCLPKAKVNTANHVCSANSLFTPCPSCHLNFQASNLRKHLLVHGDPDVVRENIQVLSLDLAPQETDSENETPRGVEIHTGEGSSCSSVNMTVVAIYQCTCGLHFLDQTSLGLHTKVCNPKIRSKKPQQKCTKCGLLFSPNVLFSHLIRHHGDKNQKYTFKVISKTDIRKLYKCQKCELHFVEGKEASRHLNSCKGSITEGRSCDYCNLKFNESCFDLHEENHFEVGEIHHEIFEIRDCSIPLNRVDDAFDNCVGNGEDGDFNEGRCE